jgi:hypothetical protein
MHATSVDDTATAGREFHLSPQQIAFFETFGFLRLPGLFADDVDELIDGFERVFATNPTWEFNEGLHFDQRRVVIPGFIDRDERLRELLVDPRVTGVVDALMGTEHEFAQSDGNLFYCDTSWHPDTYSAPMTQLHVKLSFYLDPLHGESGAIRMIPGTNHWRSPYATMLRRDLDTPQSTRETFGVEVQDIPSWTLESEPGDLIIWSFRTIHGSFSGGERRRLFSVNFREVVPATG